MQTNLDLQIQALELVKQELSEAIRTNATFLVLLEIKSRLETIKDLCFNDLVISYKKAV